TSSAGFADNKGVPKNVLPEKDTDGWDSTLNAVYFTALDSNINWSSDTNVIVFISNNLWKYAEDDNPIRGLEYKFPSPDGNPTNDPCEQGPVSKKLLLDTLEKRKILLIGILTPSIYRVYNNFFKTANSPDNYHMLEINGADATAAGGITELIMPIIRKRVCTCDIQYEFALVLDSTQTFTGLYPDNNLRFRCEFASEFAAKCPPIRWRIRSELVATPRFRSEVAATPRFLHEFASESADISLRIR
ncbi:hypothetical protein Fcan01_23206, partial [Folsomia candida]